MTDPRMNGPLTPGFADPVAGSQACFRAVLAAMSRPGSVHTLDAVTPPPQLCVAAAAVVLTLVDHETPVWIDPAAAAAQPWIAFHTGAASVSPGAAGFALALSLPPLDALNNGADETPEASATIILQVASVTSGTRFSLEGPGLPTPAMLAVTGLPADFATLWQRNHARFPCGVDLILCAGNQVAALPRTTTVREV